MRNLYTIFQAALLLLAIFSCTKEKDPEPEHPDKAELHGSWLPGRAAVCTLHQGADSTVVELEETHVYEYTFSGDSVTTWFDNWQTETRRIQYPLLLPDGMDHSHTNGSYSKTELEVVKLTGDTLQLRAKYDYPKVYLIQGTLYGSERSDLVLTYRRMQ